jgi:hypothetical protein
VAPFIEFGSLDVGDDSFIGRLQAAYNLGGETEDEYELLDLLEKWCSF